jgi:spectinomycin phosphotransferase
VTTINDRKVIIKKTKKEGDRARKLISFQGSLINKGVSLVSPVLFKGEDHHMIEENRWVVYPFINGPHYTGNQDEIFRAGQLLGQIHMHSKDIFTHGFSLSSYDDEFIEEVLGDINTVNRDYKTEFKYDQKSIKTLIKEIDQYNLVHVDGTWDYKGNNLIFGDKVTLIDSDNSGKIPRIVDLAIACLLFNTECKTAPNRLFTKDEWQVFLSGYKEHITLSSDEIACFPLLLELMFLDEGLYAVVDLEDDEGDYQKEFIVNLTQINFTKYYI